MRFTDALLEGIDLLKERIRSITTHHPKYVASCDQIRPETFSMEYSTIRLPYKTKCVQCYYSKEGLSWYHRLMDDYERSLLHPKKEENIGWLFNEFYKAVSQWNAEKLVVMKDITTLAKQIEKAAHKLSGERLRISSHRQLFLESNTPETVLLDRVAMRFKNETDIISYNRIFYVFFGKKKMSINRMLTKIDYCIKKLDTLAECMDMLMTGYDKIGKGEAFERHRTRQHTLLYAAQQMADLLEAEILRCEDFIEIAQIPISVRLYPKEEL